MTGQFAALGVARWAFGLDLPWLLLVTCVVCASAANAVLALTPRRFFSKWSATRTMGGVLVFDTVVLTALLAGSGGPMNPFTQIVRAS